MAKDKEERLDITKLEFGIATMIKIIVVVALAVSAAVTLQYQIITITERVTKIEELVGSERKPDEGTVLYEIDAIKIEQDKKVNRKQFKELKTLVEKKL